MGPMAGDDWSLRARIYRHLADHGTAPSADDLAAWVGDGASAQSALRRLHDAHQIVLDATGSELLMALPFAAQPTAHRIVSGDDAWWANCAWDSLAIPAALDIDAQIEARWLDDDFPVDIRVVDGRLEAPPGFVHFTVPARSWWGDIVET